MTQQELIEQAIATGVIPPGVTKGTPDYQHTLYEANGQPYFNKVGGGKLYVPPASAMSMFDDPRALQWARSQGYYIDGGREGLEASSQPTTDAQGRVTQAPSPVHTQDQSNGFFHTRGTWDADEGKFESSLDWGNILTLVVAGALTAGVATAVMGGGAAAEAAVSTAVSTGSAEAGVSAGVAAGATPAMIGGTTAATSGGITAAGVTSAGLPAFAETIGVTAPAIAAGGTGAGVGTAIGAGVGTGVAASTLPHVGMNGLTLAPDATEGGVVPAEAASGAGAGAPLATNSLSGAPDDLGDGLLGNQPAAPDANPNNVARPQSNRLVQSLTSPGTIATLASGGMDLIGNILAANNAKEQAQLQNDLTRDVSALNATQMNPVSQNMDLAHASGVGAALAHGPVRLGVNKPFDLTQAQAFLSPDSLAYSTGRFNDQVQKIGTTSKGVPPAVDLTKMGFPAGSVGGPAPTPTPGPAPPQQIQPALPNQGVPNMLSAPSPDPRRESLMASVAGAPSGQPTNPTQPAAPDDYFTRRRKQQFNSPAPSQGSFM